MAPTSRSRSSATAGPAPGPGAGQSTRAPRRAARERYGRPTGTAPPGRRTAYRAAPATPVGYVAPDERVVRTARLRLVGLAQHHYRLVQRHNQRKPRCEKPAVHRRLPAPLAVTDMPATHGDAADPHGNPESTAAASSNPAHARWRSDRGQRRSSTGLCALRRPPPPAATAEDHVIGVAHRPRRWSDAATVAALLDAFNREYDTPTPGTAVLTARLGRLLAGGDGIVLLTRDPLQRYAGPVAERPTCRRPRIPKDCRAGRLPRSRPGRHRPLVGGRRHDCARR